jgi:hypothetical protein
MKERADSGRTFIEREKNNGEEKVERAKELVGRKKMITRKQREWV